MVSDQYLMTDLGERSKSNTQLRRRKSSESPPPVAGRGYLSKLFRSLDSVATTRRCDSDEDSEMGSSIIDDVVVEKGSTVSTQLPPGTKITYLGKTNNADDMDGSWRSHASSNLAADPSPKTQAILIVQHLKEREKHEKSKRKLIRGSEAAERGLEEFGVAIDDVVDIVEDDKAFSQLQAAVASSGAITNGVLKQNLHYYAKYNRSIKAQSPSPTSPPTLSQSLL